MPNSPLLQLDHDRLRSDFDKRPFKIAHTLMGHPLLELPRLVELARRLQGSVLYFRADHEVNQVDAAEGAQRTFVQRGLARPALSVEQTVAQIESCNAWMQLRDVGQDPDYRALLDALMAEFRAAVEPISPHMTGARADIFVSSPHATTPFHLDEEHNFLLQVRGEKRLSIADGTKREVLSEEDLRSFFLGNGELARYSERLEQQSTHVQLEQGEGVHIPPCYPHWVKNGAQVSVSLGVLWHSEATARRRNLYRVNEWLRRAGIKPSAPGEQPLADTLKVLPFGLRRSVTRYLSTSPSS